MSSDDGELETSLEETEEFEPPEAFVEQANVTDEGIYEEFEDEWPECWENAAELLDWYEGYDQVLDDSNEPFYEWFTDGKLNASYNCIDRHVEEGRGDEVAIQWVGEPTEEDDRAVTYEDLLEEVEAFAAALQDLGIEEDEVVTLHMPMIPELPVAMLACARIGVPHSVVFAGFSAEALATRMNSADSEYLVTCDGYYRRGDPLDHIEKADEAVGSVEHEVSDVVAVNRLGEDGPEADLDADQHDYESLLADHEGAAVDPVKRDAEDMLFLMYTSGTTGAPKGIKHTTAGYLSWAAWTSHAVLDLEADDTYFCTADIGWITGHSYIVYGPLALGSTTVMYEGAPDEPDRDRLWEIVEEYECDQFYTAPTAIRSFMKWGSEYPERHDLSSLRLLGTVGEPINPRPWKWYYQHIGGGECPVVDTWWQTETGGIMVTTLPGAKRMKPGAAGPALPGVDVRVVDSEGDEVEGGDAGYLTVHKPWPGMLRTIYGNDERYIEEFWAEYSDADAGEWVYFPEDGAGIDEEGYITVLGRVDDTMNVSGHRIGTAEVENAAVEVQGVAEAAVVGAEDEQKGEAMYAYAITEEGQAETDELRERIVASVEDAIGPFARPQEVVFAPDLPKTRSGKIMRRLLEDVANDDDLGDTSTLRNPEIVEEIQGQASAN